MQNFSLSELKGVGECGVFDSAILSSNPIEGNRGNSRSGGKNLDVDDTRDTTHPHLPISFS